MVLGDPRKRTIYDNHGMSGVRLEGTPLASWLMFGYNELICFASSILSIIMALLIYFIVTLALRVDGKIDWSYAVVFIPIWILDLLGYLGFLGELIMLSPFQDDEDSEAPQDGSRPTRPKTIFQRVLKYAVKLLTQLLQTAFEVLIVLKANDPSIFPATVVFAPFWAIRFLEATTKMTMLVKLFRMTEGAHIDCLSKWMLAFDLFWIDSILYSLSFLIMLRIDNYITWSWFLVFSPLGLLTLQNVLSLLLRRFVISRTLTGEDRRKAMSLHLVDVAAFVVLLAIGYSFAGLLAAKLDGYAISAFVIAAPFLVILLIGICAAACCLPCAAMVARSSENGLGAGPIRV